MDMKEERSEIVAYYHGYINGIVDQMIHSDSDTDFEKLDNMLKKALYDFAKEIEKAVEAEKNALKKALCDFTKEVKKYAEKEERK